MKEADILSVSLFARQQNPENNAFQNAKEFIPLSGHLHKMFVFLAHN